MRTYLFYSQNSQGQDKIEALADELTKLKIETIKLDADTSEGTRIGELYDITQRPAAVVTMDDGVVVHRWLGFLPTASDVSYFVHSL